MCVCVYVCVCGYVCVCQLAEVLAFERKPICCCSDCVCAPVHLFMCVCICAVVCLGIMCVWLHTYTSEASVLLVVFVCEKVCVCVCVCECMFVCVHVFMCEYSVMRVLVYSRA